MVTVCGKRAVSHFVCTDAPYDVYCITYNAYFLPCRAVATVKGSSDVMTVVFKSDDGVGGQGFVMGYAPLAPSSMPLLSLSLSLSLRFLLFFYTNLYLSVSHSSPSLSHSLSLSLSLSLSHCFYIAIFITLLPIISKGNFNTPNLRINQRAGDSITYNRGINRNNNSSFSVYILPVRTAKGQLRRTQGMLYIIQQTFYTCIV